MIVGYRGISGNWVGQIQRYLRGPDKSTAVGRDACGWSRLFLSAARKSAKTALTPETSINSILGEPAPDSGAHRQVLR